MSGLVTTFRVSSTALGLMASGYFYSYAFFQPVVGILVDRWKPRRIIVASACLMGIGSLVFCLARGFGSAFCARVIVGLGAAGVFVPFMWLSSRLFDPNEIGFVYAVWIATGNAGAVVAAGPLGFLAACLGWRERPCLWYQ